MTATILQGSVFDVLPTVKSGSVDVCVTSPPYWQLRSYLPAGHPLKAQELGSEPTPGEYVDTMVRVFRLVRAAMADHATAWLNIGDTYSSKPPGNKTKGVSGASTLHGVASDAYRETLANSVQHKRDTTAAVPDGNLCLIPSRLVLALQSDGWLVRSMIVWHKPAPMPSSVSGWAWRRCRVKVKSNQDGKGKYAGAGVTHIRGSNVQALGGAEWSDCPGCPKCQPHGGYVLRRGSWRPTSAWEPVLMLAKSDRYFADGESVKTPPAAATVSRDKYTRVLDDADEQFAVRHDHETVCDSGANLRDVWTIGAEPLKEKHYAAFPSELVYRCLAAGTSQKGYCPACGAPWCRVIEQSYTPSAKTRGKPGSGSALESGAGQKVGGWNDTPALDLATQTLGWRPTCNCIGADGFDPRPGLVLDPFCGSGRTGLQARRLGLDFVGVELNPEYVEMSTRLLYEDAPLFS